MIRTLTGKNTFALKSELGRIVQDFLTEHGDLGLERIDASEVDSDTLLQSVQSLPFLVNKKLVIISNAQANNEFLERIGEVVERTPDSVDVLIIDQSFDKRKSSFKEIKTLTKLTEFSEINPQLLPEWLVNVSKSMGAQITSQDAKYLVARTGTSQQMLFKELEKLSTYSTNITRENIDKLTDESAQSSIFSLLDAAFSGDGKRAIELYRDQRKQKIEPQYIVAMLTWQLQALAQAVYAQPQTESALVSMGMSPYVAKKALVLAKQVNKKDVIRYVNDLCELSIDIVTTSDADAALELYLLNLEK